MTRGESESPAATEPGRAGPAAPASESVARRPEPRLLTSEPQPPGPARPEAAVVGPQAAPAPRTGGPRRGRQVPARRPGQPPASRVTRAVTVAVPVSDWRRLGPGGPGRWAAEPWLKLSSNTEDPGPTVTPGPAGPAAPGWDSLHTSDSVTGARARARRRRRQRVSEAACGQRFFRPI